MSRIEIEAEETSYTYLTLTRLKEAYPDTKFFFIMGADSLDYFEHWFHPEIICEKATVLVAVRDSMDLAVIDEKIAAIKQLFPAEIYPIRGGRTDVSSTEIRTALSDMAAEQGDDTIGIMLLGYADIVATRKLLNPNEYMGVIKTYMEYVLTNYIYKYKQN